MILFSYSDTYTKVKCNLIERREIRRMLAARPDGYMFAPKFKKKLWDGYISLLDKSNKFPSGLLGYVLANLDALNYEYDVLNYEEPLSAANFDIPNYTFRDYQTEAVEAALMHGRGILKMATNAGKTLIAAAIIKATGHKAVIIVPTQALLLQTATDLENMLGMTVGRYGAGHNSKEDVTVTTMASLKKLLSEDLSYNITVVVDECHHGKSDQIFDRIFIVPGAYRFGMSGTPLTYQRLSDLKLIGATGDVIYEETNAELISAGWSAKPIIKFRKIADPKLPAKSKDFQDIYRQGIVSNPRRNSIIASIASKERSRGPVLIICNWVEHVNNIVALDDSFLQATGSTPTRELEQLLLSFNNSHDVLVTSPVFGEGVNIPSVATLIMAGGNKSHIQILQRIGRGLRVTEGKDTLHVYDFIDASHKYLLKHSEQRYKLYKDEGFAMEMIA